MDELISKKAAIDALKRKQDDGKGDLSRFYNTIIQHDIEAIKQLPPIQPVNCSEFPNNSDAISRQAAIEALVSMTIYTKEELKEYREESAYKDCWTNGIYDAVEKIEKLPPIQPKLLQPWEVLVAQAVLPQSEIVRCKDCKYAEYIDDVQTLWCTECGQGRTVAPNDFCSYAERREVTT